MRNHVNLMTERATLMVSLRHCMRYWATAVAALVAVLTPIAAGRWLESRQTWREFQAIEASYEPIRRLSEHNRELCTDARNLVSNERVELQLARYRPVTSLLARVSAAAAASDGQLYVEELSFTQQLPGVAADGVQPGRVTIHAVCSLTYDIATFMHALRHPPIADVQARGDAVTNADGIDRKSYVIECTY